MSNNPKVAIVYHDRVRRNGYTSTKFRGENLELTVTEEAVLYITGVGILEGNTAVFAPGAWDSFVFNEDEYDAED